MSINGFLILTALIAAITFNEVSGLKCWRCSSDATNTKFCDDPFLEDEIEQRTKSVAYVDCNPLGSLYPNNAIRSRPACQKVKKTVNGKETIYRSCVVENANDPVNKCMPETTPSYVKIEYCETCYTDGCNGAAEYGPILGLILIPAAIAKILL